MERRRKTKVNAHPKTTSPFARMNLLQHLLEQTLPQIKTGPHVSKPAPGPLAVHPLSLWSPSLFLVIFFAALKVIDIALPNAANRS